MSKPTIVLVHQGSSPLLQVVFTQAYLSNPEADLILVGDQTAQESLTTSCNYVRFVPIDRFNKSSLEFQKLYRHQSTNSYEYELFCFQRWFIMLEFLESESINSEIIYLDSDALLYIEGSLVFRNLRSEMSVCDEAVPSFIFFSKSDALMQYCKFLSETFESDEKYAEVEKWVSELPTKNVVQISDMATLGYFAKLNDLDDIGKAERIDFMFDQNVGWSQGVRTGILGKSIIRRAGKKYFLRHSGGLVLAGGVHLQGWNKSLWPFFVDKKVLWECKTELMRHAPRLIRAVARSFKIQMKRRMASNH